MYNINIYKYVCLYVAFVHVSNSNLTNFDNDYFMHVAYCIFVAHLKKECPFYSHNCIRNMVFALLTS